MTFWRSARSFLVPEAVSLNTPTTWWPARLAKEITLLAGARLIVGRNTAVDGDLSQLNLLGVRTSRRGKMTHLR
jgi:hypothetical protein